MDIILTGFEPFNQSRTNPSAEIINHFPDQPHEDYTLIKEILPVENGKAVDWLTSAIQKYEPDIIIMLGEASTRPVVSIEKVAINWMDYRIADNAGNQIVDQFIFDDGPAAYFSSLPVRSIYKHLIEVGIPAEISLSAGAYLCNQVFYSSMYFLNQFKINSMCGFIHLPPLPEQVIEKSQKSASMSLDLSMSAVTTALNVCIQNLT